MIARKYHGRAHSGVRGNQKIDPAQLEALGVSFADLPDHETTEAGGHQAHTQQADHVRHPDLLAHQRPAAGADEARPA